MEHPLCQHESFSVDGTKIKANASDLRTHKKSEWETRKEVMKQAILDYLSSSINPDRKEDKLPGKETSGYEISSKESDDLIADFIRLQRQARREGHKKQKQDGRKYTSYHAKPADCVICTVRKECCTAKVKIAAITFNFSKMIPEQLV